MAKWGACTGCTAVLRGPRGDPRVFETPRGFRDRLRVPHGRRMELEWCGKPAVVKWGGCTGCTAVLQDPSNGQWGRTAPVAPLYCRDRHTEGGRGPRGSKRVGIGLGQYLTMLTSGCSPSCPWTPLLSSSPWSPLLSPLPALS